MKMQSRVIIVIAVVACAVTLALGIIIGHFAIEKADDTEGQGDSQKLNAGCGAKFTAPWKQYRESYLDNCVKESCMSPSSCNTEDLPRTFLAYHLNGKTVNIDGKLDDEAWTEIPYSETFMDIRGPDYPTPYFNTRFKVRWDDDRLYVGALMDETDFWGTYTVDESQVWRENAFEVYAVPDGSMHNYKEMQISVRNVTWDLMLKKAYMDKSDICDRTSVAVSSWDSDMHKGTHTDGIINDPNGKGSYWSAEWSFSFARLAQHTDRPNNKPTPDADEAWFFIFARPEYKFKIVNGQYRKDEDAPTEWWSWQPMYAVNLHLPSRFGLVQFKRNMDDKTFHFNKWHIYRALFEVFEAEHKYKSVNGMFIDDLKKLSVAPKIMSSECVTITIQSNDTYFRASVKSNIDPNMQTGNIRPDRYVWFT
ncbi:uncharacterized protein LOC132715684 [Ruditapes philippinarum]|uniref:uncharacterized protein LOC132715684 n=1 Tax=Ruditapes philippinarum TaxID=129788 RepID=UPI00295B0567|nr:uncharacterized protein LOC132715684 [Ruditapes philippinarum]